MIFGTVNCGNLLQNHHVVLIFAWAESNIAYNNLDELLVMEYFNNDSPITLVTYELNNMTIEMISIIHKIDCCRNFLLMAFNLRDEHHSAC